MRNLNSLQTYFNNWFGLIFLFTLTFATLSFVEIDLAFAQDPVTTESSTNSEEKAVEVTSGELASPSIFGRSMDAGPVVFLVLLILVALSIASWAVAMVKFMHLKKINQQNEDFIGRFWENKSLNDLNSKLVKFDDSPAKELFKAGYSELVKGSQLKDQASDLKLGISAAMSNIARTLNKSKNMEKRKMENYLPLLAISASAGPFIGLFGTVWGIMTAFEGIAQTGSASLAAVAPGISEALIATAFGLAAAIPAVIGYNIANNKIRSILIKVDGFGSDFLNIVERYLVVDTKNQKQNTQPNTPGI